MSKQNEQAGIREVNAMLARAAKILQKRDNIEANLKLDDDAEICIVSVSGDWAAQAARDPQAFEKLLESAMSKAVQEFYEESRIHRRDLPVWAKIVEGLSKTHTEKEQ